ncbi:MAG: ABC transporter ATP-binding protein/permease, partial [Lachnospiraceae bacterium]|nr:ABC transporter ATP-binding protein/permease [Lachnospiraceae bacterium]
VLLNELAKLHENILYLQILKRVDDMEVKSESHKGKVNSSFRGIEFKNVSFSYPGQRRKVLKNISFVFERGKTYSIVGFNGAGKTTLLKLLLGLYEPETGEILIDGVNLNQLNIAEYYSLIGAVFQDFIKYPFTIEENISTELNGLNAEDIFEAIKFANLEDMVKKLPEGIKTVLMREWNNGMDISQGQWQKIAIARCYYRKPTIMILDEPFSSVDIESENSIVGNIKQTSDKQLNIFITHHFSSISMADEVIVMDDGRIIEQGTHNELIEKRGRYFQLYSEQLENLNKMNK